jgi:hypothetical protein
MASLRIDTNPKRSSVVENWTCMVGRERAGDPKGVCAVE